MSFSGGEHMSETTTQRRSKNSLQSSHLHYAIPDIQIHMPDEDTDTNYSGNSSASSETDVDSRPQSQLDSIEDNFPEASQNSVFDDDDLYNNEQENASSSIMSLPDLNNYMVIPNVDPSKNLTSKSNSTQSVNRSNYFKATTEEGDEISQSYIHNKQPDKKSGFLSNEISVDKQRRKSVTDLAPFMQPRKSIVELTPAMQARISVFETNSGIENQILKPDDTDTERRKSFLDELPTVERRRSIRAEVLELERRYLSGDERANTDYLPETKDEIQALQRRRSIRNEILSFERRGSMQDQTLIPPRRRSREDGDENLRRKSIKSNRSEDDNEMVMRAEVMSPEKGMSIKKKILEMDRRKSIKESERGSTNGYRNTPEIEIQPPNSDEEFSDTEEQYFRSVKPYLKYRKSISDLEPYFHHQSEAWKLSSSVQEEIARREEESAEREGENDTIPFSYLIKNNSEQEHLDCKSERREYQNGSESENMSFHDSRRSSRSSATSKERQLVSRDSRPLEKVDGDQDIIRKQLLEHQNSIAMEESEFIGRRLSNDPLTYSERNISDSTNSHSNRNSFSLDTVQKSSRKNSFSAEGSLKSSGSISSQGDRMQINETSTGEPPNNLTTDSNTEVNQRRKSIALEVLGFLSRRLSNALEISDENQTFQNTDEQEFQEGDYKSRASSVYSHDSKSASRKSSLIDRKLSQGSTSHEALSFSPQESTSPSCDNLGTEEIVQYDQRRKSVTMEALDFMVRKFSSEPIPDHQSKRSSVNPEEIGDLEETENMPSMTVQTNKEDNHRSMSDRGSRRSSRSSVHNNHRLSRGSVTTDDHYGSQKDLDYGTETSRSRRSSASVEDGHRSQRGSIAFDRRSVSLEYGHKSQRNSLINEDGNRSRRSSINADDYSESHGGSILVHDGQRSRKNSEVMEDARSHRGSISDNVNYRSPRGSISLHETSNRGSGLFDEGKTSPRGSISSEGNYRSRQGSISVEEGQRSHSGSVTIQDGQRSQRNSLYEEEQAKSRDRSRKSSIINDNQDEKNDNLQEETDGEPRRKSIGMEVLGFITRRFSNASENEVGPSIPSITVEEHEDSQTYESPQGSRKSSIQSYHRSSVDEYQRESQLFDEEAIGSRKSSISTKDGRRSQRGSISAEDGQLSRKGSMVSDSGRRSSKGSMVDGGQRSRKNSEVMEDARSHRGSISDNVNYRSPRGSISLHETQTSNRGSGLFDDSKTSPRGSISSEGNYRSHQGSISVDEGQRSRSGSITIQDGQRSQRNSLYEEEQDKSRDRSRKSSIINDNQDEKNDSLREETDGEPRRKSIGMEVLGFITRRFSNASEKEVDSSIPSITVEEHEDSLTYESPEGSRRSSVQSYHRSSADEYHRSQRDEEAIGSRKSSVSSRDGRRSQRGSVSADGGRRSQRGSVSAEDGHTPHKGSMSFEDGTKYHRDSISSGGGQISRRLSQEVHEMPVSQEKTINSRKSSHTHEVYNVSQFISESDTEPNDMMYDKYKDHDIVSTETSDVVLHHYIQRSFSEETPEVTDYLSDSESGSELNFELALNEIESYSQPAIMINENQAQKYKMTMQQQEILVMNKYKDEKETPDLYEALYGHIITLLTLPELGGKEHEVCATFIPDVTLESSINDTEWNEISQKYKNITGFSTPGITQMSSLTTLDKKGGWTTVDALQNQKQRKPLDSITTVTFCGCGFLGGYLVGAATYLQERAPHLLQGRLAGSSVGSLVAACLACDVPLEYVRKNILATADVAQKYLMGPFNPFFPIEEPLLKNLLKMIPEDGHIRASGRLFLSLTRATTLTNEIVSEYSSRDELVRAILCCCFLPFISGFSVPSFNGRKYIDGGMSNNMPLKGPNTLTINAFSGDFDICPEDPDGPERPLATAFNQSIRMTNNNGTRLIHSLLPPSSEVLDKHFQQGYNDAKNYFPLWNTK